VPQDHGEQHEEQALVDHGHVTIAGAEAGGMASA
jgi:hypothetical protein